MSRRVLIVEPDLAGRTMMERTLAGVGFSAHASASAHEARGVLDGGEVLVVVIDELAGTGGALAEVRWLHATYPTVPLIVTGGLLSRRVMLELVRLHVADALVKPFTPAELRAAVMRAINERANLHEASLEYAAAITEARHALARGDLADARPLLARAHAISPLDAEVMALHALVSELGGRDDEAARGYRAAIALRDEEASAAPDPHEGLARLAAYRGAEPVSVLPASRRGLPVRVVSDPGDELGQQNGRPEDQGAHLVLLSLGLTFEDHGGLFLRDGPGPRAFAVIASSLRPESVAAALEELGAGALSAWPATAARLDLARVEQLRRAPSEEAS